MLSRTVSLLPVVAYDEIVLGTEIEPIETISFGQTEMPRNAKQQPAPALAGGTVL